MASALMRAQAGLGAAGSSFAGVGVARRSAAPVSAAPRAAVLNVEAKRVCQLTGASISQFRNIVNWPRDPSGRRRSRLRSNCSGSGPTSTHQHRTRTRRPVGPSPPVFLNPCHVPCNPYAYTTPDPGKKRNKANVVTFSNKHNRKWQEPNLQQKKVYWETGKRWVKLRICTKAIKSIEKNGLDAMAAEAGIDLWKLPFEDARPARLAYLAEHQGAVPVVRVRTCVCACIHAFTLVHVQQQSCPDAKVFATHMTCLLPVSQEVCLTLLLCLPACPPPHPGPPPLCPQAANPRAIRNAKKIASSKKQPRKPIYEEGGRIVWVKPGAQ